ncbi:MAG: hypothetical protein AAB503_02395 [Patescibacteria group bacterium]
MDWKRKSITVIIVSFLILSFVMAYVPLLFPAPPQAQENNDITEGENSNSLPPLEITTQATSTATSSTATSTQ